MRQSDQYYADLEQKLLDLRPLVETLGVDALRWFDEWRDAGEYGLAVEHVVEALPVTLTDPTLRELADGLASTAAGMGLESVAKALRAKREQE